MRIANVPFLYKPLNLGIYKRLEKCKVIHYIMRIADVPLLSSFKLKIKHKAIRNIGYNKHTMEHIQ